MVRAENDRPTKTMVMGGMKGWNGRIIKWVERGRGAVLHFFTLI